MSDWKALNRRRPHYDRALAWGSVVVAVIALLLSAIEIVYQLLLHHRGHP